MSSLWDVVVVGAGPAGAVSAMLAARAGLRVAVLDAAEFPRRKVCGEYLSPAAWELLDRFGLGELHDRSVPLTTMQLTADESHELSIPFHDAPPRAISRRIFDVRLLEAARQAGATVMTGVRIRHVTVEGGRAVGVECAGHHDHEPGERFAARLILGADGRRSTVVRDTGRLVRRDSGLVGFKRHVQPAGPPPPSVIGLHALAGGYFGSCPTEDGTLNLCGVLPAELVRAARGDVAAALDAWLVDRPTLRSHVDAAGEEPWSSMPDVSLQTARPTVAGVLYVGDAQGTIEPLTGQGMTMALAAAQFAADVIARFGVDGIGPAAQRAYAAAWRRAFAAPIRAATWFGRLLRRPRLLKRMMIAGGLVPGLSERLLRGAHRRTRTLVG